MHTLGEARSKIKIVIRKKERTAAAVDSRQIRVQGQTRGLQQRAPLERAFWSVKLWRHRGLFLCHDPWLRPAQDLQFEDLQPAAWDY